MVPQRKDYFEFMINFLEKCISSLKENELESKVTHTYDIKIYKEKDEDEKDKELSLIENFNLRNQKI
jgi:hypothetical protein